MSPFDDESFMPSWDEARSAVHSVFASSQDPDPARAIEAALDNKQPRSRRAHELNGSAETEIRRLSKLSPDEYAQQRKAAAEKLNVLLSVLDRAVKAAQRAAERTALAADKASRLRELARLPDGTEFEEKLADFRADYRVSKKAVMADVKRLRDAIAKAEAPAPKKTDIGALEQSAHEIIKRDDVLELFAEVIGRVITGEVENSKLLYLTGTSRLFRKTMHAAVKGPSGSGKSEVRTSVVSFFPDESVFKFTVLSEKALLYMPGDCRHKIMSMGEATDMKQTEFQDNLLRQFMSDGRLEYPVVKKDQTTGEFVTVTIVIEGPVAFFVTTTKDKLHPENETRMLSLEVDDSQKQTERVIDKVAELEGLNQALGAIDFRPWHDYQRWLATGDLDVVIPFARALARLIPAKAVRLRRDFGQLLRAIKAHALLHRVHRARNEKGEIVATIEGDYEVVRKLMGHVLAEGAEVSLSKENKQTVEAVAELMAEKAPTLDEAKRIENDVTVSTRQVADKLKLDRSSAHRRLQKAVNTGLIVNRETKPPPAPAKWAITGEERPGETLLPTAEKLKAEVQRPTPRPPLSEED
jgi:hypothetical protein